MQSPAGSVSRPDSGIRAHKAGGRIDSCREAQEKTDYMFEIKTAKQKSKITRAMRSFWILLIHIRHLEKKRQ